MLLNNNKNVNKYLLKWNTFLCVRFEKQTYGTRSGENGE